MLNAKQITFLGLLFTATLFATPTPEQQHEEKGMSMSEASMSMSGMSMSMSGMSMSSMGMSSSSTEEEEEDYDEPAAALVQMIAASNPGAVVVDLTTLTLDDTVKVIPSLMMGTVVPGQTVTVGVNLFAKDTSKTVTHVIVSFGMAGAAGGGAKQAGSPPTMGIQLPVDSPLSGNGTATVTMTIPQEICDNLASICHQVWCYESAQTSIGTITASDIAGLALACGDTPGSCTFFVSRTPSPSPTPSLSFGASPTPSETLPVCPDPCPIYIRGPRQTPGFPLITNEAGDFVVTTTDSTATTCEEAMSLAAYSLPVAPSCVLTKTSTNLGIVIGYCEDVIDPDLCRLVLG